MDFPARWLFSQLRTFAYTDTLPKSSSVLFFLTVLFYMFAQNTVGISEALESEVVLLNFVFWGVGSYLQWMCNKYEVKTLKKKKKKNLPANAGDTGSIPGPGEIYIPLSN